MDRFTEPPIRREKPEIDVIDAYKQQRDMVHEQRGEVKTSEMGEIAEMMLDGTLCEHCGVYIEEGEPEGVPRSCEDCQ